MVTENSWKKLSSKGPNKDLRVNQIIFFKTCLHVVNLISTLVVLYGTNYVPKKGF